MLIPDNAMVQIPLIDFLALLHAYEEKAREAQDDGEEDKSEGGWFDLFGNKYADDGTLLSSGEMPSNMRPWRWVPTNDPTKSRWN